MVVSSASCCADSDCCCANGSFESSGSVPCLSSSPASSLHSPPHACGSNEEHSHKLSCSSSSTDATSRNSCERGAPSLNNTCCSPVSAGKPHKAQDDTWACIQSLKSRVGNLGISHFKLICRVGHGDIGHVFLAQLRGTRCFFAMKVMDKEALKQRKKLQRMHREREILGFIDHPFLPTLYAHFEAEQFSCLVMDYCSGGDLHALRQKFPGRRFVVKAARFYAAEVLVALEYLHMLGIVYRDLKPENVLVRGDGHIMLTDFDLSFKSDVEPKLLKCPLSASSSSSSGRFGLLRSFSVSSSVSSTSFASWMEESSIECRLPTACGIHPFLGCLPLAAGASRKDQQHRHRVQKSPLSILCLRQSMKSKPKIEGHADKAAVQCEKQANDKESNVQEQDEIDSYASSQTLPKPDVALLTTEKPACMLSDPSQVGGDEALLGLQLIAEPTLARSMSFVGTHEYLSPEMVQGQGHGNAVDWWTFGIFLFELLYGKTPFKGSCNEHTLLNIIRQQVRFPDWAHVHVGEHAKNLIEGLLQKDPGKRLGSMKGAAEIKVHPFFQGVNWALIRSTQPPELPKVFKSQGHHQQHETKNGFINAGQRAAPPKANPHYDYF